MKKLLLIFLILSTTSFLSAHAELSMDNNEIVRQIEELNRKVTELSRQIMFLQEEQSKSELIVVQCLCIANGVAVGRVFHKELVKGDGTTAIQAFFNAQRSCELSLGEKYPRRVSQCSIIVN